MCSNNENTRVIQVQLVMANTVWMGADGRIYWEDTGGQEQLGQSLQDIRESAHGQTQRRFEIVGDTISDGFRV